MHLKSWIILITTIVIVLLLVNLARAESQIPTKKDREAEEKIRKEEAKKAIAEAIKRQEDKKKTSINGPEGETAEQKIVRLRAIKIEADKGLKKAQDELEKEDTPAMQEARKKIAKEAKQAAKLEKGEEQIIALASISGCQVGGVGLDLTKVEAGVGVWINPKAEDYRYWTDMVSVTITNTTIFPYDIRTAFRAIGIAVKNLCPGGSIQLYFAREEYNPTSEYVILKAEGRLLNTVIQTEPISFSLNYSSPSHRTEHISWDLTKGRVWW